MNTDWRQDLSKKCVFGVFRIVEWLYDVFVVKFFQLRLVWTRDKKISRDILLGMLSEFSMAQVQNRPTGRILSGRVVKLADTHALGACSARIEGSSPSSSTKYFMNKNIEVEIRGPLTKEEFDNLVCLFEVQARKTSEKDRVLIDYSTFLEGGVENRHKDIRLRVTNGIPEIIVKIGEWGGTEHRKELSVFTKQGEFDTLVEIFGELGFRKGMLCVRKSKVYEYKDIEFALVEVPGHSYYYEAEKMVHEKEDADKIIKEIKNVCKDLNLEIFDKKQFFEYIKELNDEANEIFDYKNLIPDYFKNRFDL